MCLVASLLSVTQPHWTIGSSRNMLTAGSFMLSLLTCSALLPEFSPPSSSGKFLQNSALLSSSREPSLNLRAFLWRPEQEEARSAVPEVNILPFVAWEIAGSSNLRNSPEEQADLVTHRSRLLLNDKAISS